MNPSSWRRARRTLLRAIVAEIVERVRLLTGWSGIGLERTCSSWARGPAPEMCWDRSGLGASRSRRAGAGGWEAQGAFLMMPRRSVRMRERWASRPAPRSCAGDSKPKRRICHCLAEFNDSMPGHLKNVIDWVSRFRLQPFNGRHALLLRLAIDDGRKSGAVRTPRAARASGHARVSRHVFARSIRTAPTVRRCGSSVSRVKIL